MRPFEILIFINLFTILVFLLFTEKIRLVSTAYLFITLIIAICHVLLEGYRWQMYPAYLFTLVICIICLRNLFFSVRNRKPASSNLRHVMRYLGITLVFLLLVIAIVPPFILPVFRIPEPSGSLAVGTTTTYFRDTGRIDEFSQDPEDGREISVRIWYPAVDGEKKQRLPYMKQDEARIMSQFFNAPEFLLSHFTLVKTHSNLDAPPLEGSFPLIFYSPSGDMVQNTVTFQELASHGYIVICVGHPYWNAFYYDQNGQVVPFDKTNDYYNSMWEEEGSDTVIRVKEMITAAKDLNTKKVWQKNLNQVMPLEVGDIRLWAGDLSFLLDQIELGSPAFGSLLQQMNMDQVGVIGFSKGGAASGQFAVTDPRCRAGINLSGFMFGDIVESGLEIPFMFMENTEEWCADCNPICEVLYEDAKSDAYMVRIEGAKHGNFCDWSLVGPYLKLIGITGPISGRRFLEIQNYYVCSFFNQYLKGMDAHYSDGNQPIYSEVEFSSK